MKRKIGTILLALSIATISITACGKKTDTVETNADTVGTNTDTVETNTDAVGTSTGADGSNVKTDVVTQLEESTTNADGSVENAKRTESIAEIQKTLKEKGYTLTVENIEEIQRAGWDPLDVGVVEYYESDKYIEENGLTIAEFNAIHGGDLTFGWTWIYNHGGAAGDQPTYGIYFKPGSPLYGTRYELGDYVPSGDQICGATGEEYCKMLDQELVETAKEQGLETYVDTETGRTVIVID